MNIEEITIQRTVQELAIIAYADVADIYRIIEEQGISGIPKEVLPAIAEIKQSEVVGVDGSTKIHTSIKMHDKTQALNMLAQMFGLKTDFNLARASLKKYGIALLEDPDSATGWRLEPHALSGQFIDEAS